MKRLLFAFLLLSSSLSAQTTIPNGDFENWNNLTGYNQPDDWLASTHDSLAPVSQTTDAYSGSYAARLQTYTCCDTNIVELTNGAIISITPLNTRPTSLNGYYKYAPQTIDTCYMAIMLTKWNVSTASRDSIGFGEYRSSVPTGVYISFQANINYYSSEVPDTALIALFSSGTTDPLDSGSVLIIDNLSFQNTTGLDNQIASLDMKIYPNPSSGKFQITDQQFERVQVYNQLGSLVLRSTSSEIDITNQPSGVYHIILIAGDNKKNFRIVKL